MLPGLDALPLRREFKKLVRRAMSISDFALTLLDDTSASEARGTLGLGAGADIASAATLVLTGRTGNLVRITGTATVNAFTMNNGDTVMLVADGALPLNVAGVLAYTCNPGEHVLVSQDRTGVQHAVVLKAGYSGVGEIVLVLGNTAPPGTIKLNGALLSRTTYAALWAYAQASGNIEASDANWSANRTTNGTNGKFSPGNGTTTFRIPDVRGDFIRAWSDGSTVDSGRAIGSAQADEIKSHTHSAANFSGSQVPSYGSGVPMATSGNTGATGGAETRPRNTALLACIKY